MSGKSVNIEGKKNNKSNFYKSKKLFKIERIDINKILVSRKESYWKKNSIKYFIGYNGDVIRPLCMKLPQMIGYIKHFEGGNKTMSVKARDNKLLKQNIKILEKVSSFMNIKFDSEPVYGDNDQYIKTKLMLYDGRINTNFQDKRIRKENTSYKCLSLIILHSVINVNKKYHPKHF